MRRKKEAPPEFEKRVYTTGLCDWYWEVRRIPSYGHTLASGRATSRDKANAAVASAIHNARAKDDARWVSVSA